MVQIKSLEQGPQLHVYLYETFVKVQCAGHGGFKSRLVCRVEADGQAVLLAWTWRLGVEYFQNLAETLS